MDRWVLCGYDMEENSSDGLLQSTNCPSINNASYFAKQGQRYSQTQKISLKEKKPHMNVEQKAHYPRQRQSVAYLENRSQDRLFIKSSLGNRHLEKNLKKIAFQPTVPQLQELKRIDLYSENKNNRNIGLDEVMNNKPKFFSQKITINYINSNSHVSSNPEIYEIMKGINSKELETSTQARSSTIKASNVDLELKMPNNFIPFGNQNFNMANNSEINEKAQIGQSYLKQAKNLDQMQFCRKAQSLADSEEFEEQFSLVLDKLEDYMMKESLMKEPSTPDTVSSEYFGFGM